MRYYHILTFGSAVAATLSMPDIASARPNEAPSLVKREEPAYASPYTYIGCYADSYSNRALTVGNPASESLVIEACAATCAASNYTYMGVEYGEECYCDMTLNPTANPTAETNCNTPCGGNPNEMCGGSLAIAVYEVGGTPDSADLSAESASYSYGYGPTATNKIPTSTWTPTPPVNTTGQRLKCPDDQGTIYSFNSTAFEVECNTTISGYHVSSGGNNRPGGYDPTMDLQGGLQACTCVPGCIAVVFYNNFCYYKSANYTTASPSALGYQDGAESGIIPLGNVVCPSWDGDIYNYNNASYQIQCNLDHPGYDIDSAPASPGGITVQDLQSCLQACTYVPGCVTATWVQSQQTCYYKNSQWTEGKPVVQSYTCDSGVPSAVLNSTAVVSSTASSTSSTSPGTGSATSASSTSSGTGTGSDSSTSPATSSASTFSNTSSYTSSTSSTESSATTTHSSYTYGGQTYNVYLGMYHVPTTSIGSSNSGINPAYPASNDQVNGVTVDDLASYCNSASWIPDNGQCLYSSDVPNTGSSSYEVDTAIVSTKDPNVTGSNEGIGSPGAYPSGTSTSTSSSATTTTSSGTPGSSTASSSGDAPSTTTSSTSSVLTTISSTTSSASVSGSSSSSQPAFPTSSSASTSSTSASPTGPPALISMLPTSSISSSSTSSSAPTSTGQAYYHNLQAGAYAPLVVLADMSNTTTTTPTQMIYKYLGCYSSTNSTALFTSPLAANDSVTTESCVSQCAAGNYNISGVLAGNLCGCNAKLNDTIPLDGRVDETNCNLVCSGNSTEVCGGSGNGLIGGTKYVSLYSASLGDCSFNNETGTDVACTPYYYLGPGGGAAGTSSNATAGGNSTGTSPSMAGSTSLSYVSSGYILPPSSFYTAPASSNTNGYSPALGSNTNNNGAGSVNINGGIGASETEIGQCQAPRTVVVTTDTTVTVSGPSTVAGGVGTMNGVDAENDAGSAAAATPLYNTMGYIFRPSSMYGAANQAMSGVGYSPAIGTMSQ